MKKLNFLLIALAMLISMPAMAQTRKEKKAAKKAQWEMEQQQAREEAELLHQIKMDSIRQAQADKEAERQRAEAERVRQEEQAVADKIRAEQEEAMREKEVDVPCVEESYSTVTNFRALATGESMSVSAALSAARTRAKQALAAEVRETVQTLTHDYLKSVNQNLVEDLEQRFEQLTVTKVNEVLQNSNYICEKVTKFYRNGKLVYKYYVVVDMSKETLLNPLHEALTSDKKASIDMDYNTFKAEFDKAFSEKQAE